MRVWHGRITNLFTILFRQSTELQLPSQLVEYGNSLANNGEKWTTTYKEQAEMWTNQVFRPFGRPLLALRRKVIYHLQKTVKFILMAIQLVLPRLALDLWKRWTTQKAITPKDDGPCWFRVNHSHSMQTNAFSLIFVSPVRSRDSDSTDYLYSPCSTASVYHFFISVIKRLFCCGLRGLFPWNYYSTSSVSYQAE